jgi:hypothetical protein
VPRLFRTLLRSVMSTTPSALVSPLTNEPVTPKLLRTLLRSVMSTSPHLGWCRR